MGVGKLDRLTQSVIELNQHMAVLAFTVESNRQTLEKHGIRMEGLEWLRDPRLKERILYGRD